MARRPPTKLKLSTAKTARTPHDVADVAFRTLAASHAQLHVANDQGGDVLRRVPPVSHLELNGVKAAGPRDGRHGVRPAGANYGMTAACRGGATWQRDADRPFTRPGKEDHRRAARPIITMARQFADNADKTNGKSMVIIGAA